MLTHHGGMLTIKNTQIIKSCYEGSKVRVRELRSIACGLANREPRVCKWKLFRLGDDERIWVQKSLAVLWETICTIMLTISLNFKFWERFFVKVVIFLYVGF